MYINEDMKKIIIELYLKRYNTDRDKSVIDAVFNALEQFEVCEYCKYNYGCNIECDECEPFDLLYSEWEMKV